MDDQQISSPSLRSLWEIFRSPFAWPTEVYFALLTAGTFQHPPPIGEGRMRWASWISDLAGFFASVLFHPLFLILFGMWAVWMTRRIAADIEAKKAAIAERERELIKSYVADAVEGVSRDVRPFRLLLEYHALHRDLIRLKEDLDRLDTVIFGNKAKVERWSGGKYEFQGSGETLDNQFRSFSYHIQQTQYKCINPPDFERKTQTLKPALVSELLRLGDAKVSYDPLDNGVFVQAEKEYLREIEIYRGRLSDCLVSQNHRLDALEQQIIATGAKYGRC